jgi:hypothetical protein
VLAQSFFTAASSYLKICSSFLSPLAGKPQGFFNARSLLLTLSIKRISFELNFFHIIPLEMPVESAVALYIQGEMKWKGSMPVPKAL